MITNKQRSLEIADKMKQMDKHSNVYKTLDYILTYGSITNMEAFSSHNNTRLSSTIKSLRDVYDIPIETTMATTENGKRYGIYTISKEEIL